jgi:hypothetical protein
MTATELQARMTNPALTPKQRADARRAYGQLIAANAACDAYGERVLDVEPGKGGAQ